MVAMRFTLAERPNHSEQWMICNRAKFRQSSQRSLRQRPSKKKRRAVPSDQSLEHEKRSRQQEGVMFEQNELTVRSNRLSKEQQKHVQPQQG